jgi:hypothetical protein
MTNQIPAYIEQRIRRPVPSDAHIVPGSTPVVSFGNALTAAAATIGLNPSRVEFCDKNGMALCGPSRRLATHSSLGTSDLTEASIEEICRVFEECNDYFQQNPYRKWFDSLEPFLNVFNASYYDGSACHLDLVQWATDPTWGRLKPAHIRKKLLANDAPFLVEQLRRENIRTILVNGMTVLQQLKRLLLIEFEELTPIVGLSHRDTRLFYGEVFDGVRVVGWSTNLQSSWGVTRELHNELADRLTHLS